MSNIQRNKVDLLPEDLVKRVHLLRPVELDAVDERLHLLQLEELVLGGCKHERNFR